MPKPAPATYPSLVVVSEDDADLRRLAATAIRAAGCAVVETADGREALDAVLDHRPDLLVCDICMPGMDGVDLLRGLRSYPAFSDMAVIVTTALDSRDRRVELLPLLQPVEVLFKPYSVRRLQELVRQACRRGDSPGGASGGRRASAS